MDVGTTDQRIITIAAEIAEITRDREIPGLLLKIRDVLSGIPSGTPKFSQMIADIWQYDLIQVLVQVLKQNYELVPGQWDTAVDLANLASTLFINFNPPDSDSHEYYGICLPNASENMLMLARQLQVLYIEETDVLIKKKTLDNYRTTLEAVNTLFSGHVFLTNNVLRSLWLLQMLMSDDADTAHSAQNLIQYAIRVNSDVISNLDEKVLYALLDEMVFKIASGSDKYIANSVICTLLLICKVRPYFIEIICSRYRGLRPLMSKWSGQGLSHNLKEFVALLDAGNARRAESERFHRAATIIQSVYRSFKLRRSLKQANTAISKLQKSFRLKKQLKQKAADEKKMQTELHYQLVVARKKAMRATREKQIQILRMLPASAIQKFMESQREQAAIKIQSSWRGYSVRKVILERKYIAKRTNAAIKIQRYVRKFLKRRSFIRKDASTWSPLDPLTDERRVFLQKIILDRREANPPKARSREQQVDLHNKCQELLKRHVFVNRINRRSQLHREALLAELETDSELLLSAPKLEQIIEGDAEKFKSYSLPVSIQARTNHNKELRFLNQPWWRKLGDEFQNTGYEDENIF